MHFGLPSKVQRHSKLMCSDTMMMRLEQPVCNKQWTSVYLTCSIDDAMSNNMGWISGHFMIILWYNVCGVIYVIIVLYNIEFGCKSNHDKWIHPAM